MISYRLRVRLIASCHFWKLNRNLSLTIHATSPSSTLASLSSFQYHPSSPRIHKTFSFPCLHHCRLCRSFDDGIYRVIDRKSGNKRAANYFPATSTTHKRLDLNVLCRQKASTSSLLFHIYIPDPFQVGSCPLCVVLEIKYWYCCY